MRWQNRSIWRFRAHGAATEKPSNQSAHVLAVGSPSELPPQPWVSQTARVFLRLRFRFGLLTKPQRGRWEINVEANSWANLLFADTVREALRNVAAYEQAYAGCEAWPNWLSSSPICLTVNSSPWPVITTSLSSARSLDSGRRLSQSGGSC
jgi:hypothetical protein